MALSYTVLGAGAMGLRFGVLLQELTGVKVDLLTTGSPKSTRLRSRGASTFPATTKIGTWFR